MSWRGVGFLLGLWAFVWGTSNLLAADQPPVWRSPSPSTLEDSSKPPPALPLQQASHQATNGLRIALVPLDGQPFPRLQDNLFLEELIGRWGMKEQPLEMTWNKLPRGAVKRTYSLSIHPEPSTQTAGPSPVINGVLILQGESLVFLTTPEGASYFVGAAQDDNSVILSSLLKAEIVDDQLRLVGTAETFETMAMRHVVQRALSCGASATGVQCSDLQLAELTKLASAFTQSQSAELQAVGGFIKARGPVFAQTLQTCRAAGLDADSLGLLVAALKSPDGLTAALPHIFLRVGSRIDMNRFSEALSKLVEGTMYEGWLATLNGWAGAAQSILNDPRVQLLSGCLRAFLPNFIPSVLVRTPLPPPS